MQGFQELSDYYQNPLISRPMSYIISVFLFTSSQVLVTNKKQHQMFICFISLFDYFLFRTPGLMLYMSIRKAEIPSERMSADSDTKLQHCLIIWLKKK